MRNTYNQFDKDSLTDLRNDVSEALKVLEKAGISIDMGSLRYSPSEAKATLTFKCNNVKSDPIKQSMDLQVFRNQNVSIKALNSEISINGVDYTVIGVNRRKPKMAFQVRNKSGKVFSCSATSLRNKFGPYGS